jgi:hypothetical protein
MGVARKVGIAIAAYLVLGIIFSMLLLAGFYNIHSHIIIYLLFWFFQPVFIPVNILYSIWFFY